MASTKAIGAGTVLQMDDGTGVYTAIAELVSIGELTRERPEVDSTSLSSTAREYVPGLTTAPELDREMNLLLEDATQNDLTGLAYIFNNSITRNFRLLPNGESKQIRFAAFVKSHTYGPFEIEAVKKGKARLKLTGPVTVV